MELSSKQFGAVVLDVLHRYKDATCEVDFEGRHIILVNKRQWSLGLGASREQAWLDAWRRVYASRIEKKLREPISFEMGVPRHRATLKFTEGPNCVQLLIYGTAGEKTLVASFLCKSWSDAKKTGTWYLATRRRPSERLYV